MEDKIDDEFMMCRCCSPPEVVQVFRTRSERMDYEKIAYSFFVDLSTIIWMMCAKDCQGPTHGQLGLVRPG